MPRTLEFLKITHINQIVDNYDTALAHLQDLFAGQYLREIGENPVTDGCLVDVGGEIIELLAPKVLDKAEGKQLTKYGQHYQGVELLVPSVSEAREIVNERKIPILIDFDLFFYTVPSATQGVALQIYDGDWHADPPPAPYVNPKRTATWWEEEHPVGFRGTHHLSFACADLDDAERFWCDLTGGTVTYRADRAAVGAMAVGVDIGIPIELITPNGPGLLHDYLDRYGPRIWATTYAVRDLERTAAYFESRGIHLVPGDAPGTLMLPPEHNLDVVYQFTE